MHGAGAWFSSGKLLWGSLAAVLLLSFIGIKSFYSFADLLESRELGRLDAVATLKTQEIANWLSERRADAQVLAESYTVGKLLAHPELRVGEAAHDPLLIKALQTVRTAYGYASIELFDRSGKRLMVSGHDIHQQLREDERQRLSDNRTVVALMDFEPTHDSYDTPHLSVLARVDDPGTKRDSLLGYVKLSVNPQDTLYPMIQLWPGESNSAETLLVRQEGNEVVFLNKLRHSNAAPLSLRFPITQADLPAARAVSGTVGRVDGKDYRGTAVIASVRPVDGTPWFMVAEIDKDELLQNLRYLFALTASGTGIIVALAILAFFFYARTQRMLVNAAISTREESFRKILDYGADAVIISSAQGDHVYSNREAARLFGYSNAELDAMKVSELAPDKEGLESPQSVFERLRKIGYVHDVAYFRHKTGRLIPADFSAVVLPDQSIYASFHDISNRLQLEQELKLREARFKDFSESSADWFWETDREHRFVFLTGRVSEVLGGRSIDELVGKTHREIAAGDSLYLDDIWAQHDSALAQRLPFRDLEYCILGEHDERRWLSASGIPYTDEQGQFAGYRGVGKDVTEQRRIKEELRLHQTALEMLVEERTTDLAKAEERLRLVIESTGDGIIQVDTAGTVTLANPAALRMLGYRAEELIGRPLHDTVHHSYPGGEPFPRAKCAANTAIIEGRALEMADDVYWRADGRPLPVSVATHPIIEESRPVGAVVSFQDNTSRKMIEAALRENEARFREVADAAPVLIWMSGLDKLCYWFNRGWLEFTGRTMEHEAGNGWTEGVHPDDFDRCVDTYARAFDARQPFSMEYRLLHHSGEYHWILDSGVPRFDSEHEFLGYIGSCVDIDQAKAAEAEREHARDAAEKLARVKSEFLANMSHEIRTPLNGVIGMAQIGVRESTGRGRSQELFARIIESGGLLLGIINDILDFSKIEAGKLVIEAVPVNPRRLVDQAIASLESRASEKGLILITRKSPNLPTAFIGDPLRISQILINLLANAVKFTERGEIRISAQLQDEKLVFSVQDSGIGMSPDQMARLFEPFQQADTSTTRKYGGTGLGLTICRRLTELMGGEISVTSSPGHGSTFELRLPCTVTLPSVEPGTPAGDTAKVGPRLKGIRILAAEDNEMNRLVIEDMLAQEGAKLTLVGNGKLAVDAVRQSDRSFDVVLMDVQMPEMDGLEATRLIRSTHPDLPVIGQTAHALAEDHAKCRAAGMSYIVTKPINVDDLVSAVLHHAGKATDTVLDEQSALEGTLGGYRNSAIDWEYLKGGRFKSRPELLGKIIRTFVTSYADAPARIRAYAVDDRTKLAELAHSLKGSAGFLLAHEVVAHSKAVEAACKMGSDDIESRAEAFAVSLEAILEEVKHHHENCA